MLVSFYSFRFVSDSNSFVITTVSVHSERRYTATVPFDHMLPPSPIECTISENHGYLRWKDEDSARFKHEAVSPSVESFGSGVH